MPGEAAGVLRVSVGRQAGWAVAGVAGELDYRTCAELRECLSGLVAGVAGPRVCVDLSGLEFCDSSGVSCLVRASRSVREQDGEFVLLGPVGDLARRLMSMGLSEVLPVVGELPGVRAAWPQGPPAGD